jgi:hypothetical protein
MGKTRIVPTAAFRCLLREASVEPAFVPKLQSLGPE